MSLLRIQKLPWDCQECDYHELSELLKEAFDDKDILSYSQFKYSLWEREMANVYTFVLKLEEHIIGTGSVIIEHKLFRAGKKVSHIEDIAIRKNMRGNGYGTYLMKYIEGFCKGSDCRKIILDCSMDNMVFYQKLGYNLHEYQMRLDLI